MPTELPVPAAPRPHAAAPLATLCRSPRAVAVFALALFASLLAASLAPQPAHASFDVPPSAYGEGAVHDGDARIRSRLVLDAEAVAPGDTLRVGVAFTLDPDWHIYWQNPGEAGVPTDIHFEAEGVEFGPLEWAAPTAFADPGGLFTSFGYADEVVLFSRATVSDTARGSIEVTANVDYLACLDVCIPGHSQLSRTVPVAARTTPAAPEVVQAFERSSMRVPRHADALGLEAKFHYSQTPLRPGDTFDVVVELIECQGPPAVDGGTCRDLALAEGARGQAFFPDTFSEPEVEVVTASTHPTAAAGFVLHLRARMPDSMRLAKPMLSGIVPLTTADGTPLPVYVGDRLPVAAPGDTTVAKPLDMPAWAETLEPIAATSAAGSSPAPPAPAGLLGLLLMAFVGGMILNLMPCVFPVLALKVSAFARLVHEDRRSIVAHGAAYSGGIVGSMLVLAAAVIGLRLAGTQVGWGFQFQQPHFLAALVVLLVLFALNLFGLFEVMLNPQRLHERAAGSDGLQRSVWEGVLAVVLATPCSAPFLGTAVGFALASNALTIVAVFTALGLGLAAPMVALTLVPGWARVLPKPGNWMLHLKTGLGFALLGSAIWILWLLGRQAGVDAMARMLVFCAVLGLGAWIVGRFQFQPASRLKIAAIATVGLVLGAAGAWTFPLRPADRTFTAPDSGAIAWQPWSQDAVEAALAEGRPVFVNFTADWCLTCKVNEKNAIDTAPVHAALARLDVAPLKADWTHSDEAIRQELARHGRAGVPFYLVYSPANPERPTLLPDLLTTATLVDALEAAAR